MFASIIRHKAIIAKFVIIIGLTACIELSMGRSLLGPDGKFGWWDGNIWSNENSQRVADAYSFSHVVHGILLYAFLWFVARKSQLGDRFLAAVLLEAIWEMLENSPLIINRYREATISLGYAGDSVLNSCSDILMMSLGFMFASRYRVWTVTAAVLLMEVGCLLWVRDNLTLNVIMLIHPIDAIKAWQSTGRIVP
jgi:hypothetical protein